MTAEPVPPAVPADLPPAARAVLDDLRTFLRDTPAAELFGDAEVRVRDLAHRFAAACLAAELAEKKTATTAVPSPAPAAGPPPASTPIGRPTD